MPKSSAGLLLAGLMMNATAATTEYVYISRFENEGLEGWEVRDFQNHTRYHLIDCADQPVLEAVSDDSASVLSRSVVEVDLEVTPWLHWSWKVSEPLPPHEERTKAGDDFAARLYLGFAGLFGFIGRHSLSYVWSTTEAVGAYWDNPFIPRIRYMTARSGPPYRQWFQEKRNVLEDYREVYGKDPRPVTKFGLMTDSDRYQGGLRAAARYADIYFSNSPEPRSPAPNSC